MKTRLQTVWGWGLFLAPCQRGGRMEHSQSQGSQVKLWLNRIDLNAWVRHKPRGMKQNTGIFTSECRHKHKNWI